MIQEQEYDETSYVNMCRLNELTQKAGDLICESIRKEFEELFIRINELELAVNKIMEILKKNLGEFEDEKL